MSRKQKSGLVKSWEKLNNRLEKVNMISFKILVGAILSLGLFGVSIFFSWIFIMKFETLNFFVVGLTSYIIFSGIFYSDLIKISKDKKILISFIIFTATLVIAILIGISRSL
jgi:hypothetical protein